jgi:hypothetical protein
VRFRVAGSKIICSRKDSSIENDEAYKRVVEFDAQVDSVPPHVAARLATCEVEELQCFFAERERIQAGSVEKNLLEALPGLLKESTDILNAAISVNETTYRELSASIRKLRGALNNIKPVSRGELQPLKGMAGSEAQKERLENIKRDL